MEIDCARPNSASPPLWGRLGRWLGRGVALVVLAGCGPAGNDSGVVTSRLYVADAAGGSVSVLDATTGRHTGSPVIVGASPGQMATGPAGSVVILPAARDGAHALLHLVPRQPHTMRGRFRLEWTTGIAPLGEPVREALLAADGGRHAAVVHHLPLSEHEGAARCQLLIIDLHDGRVVRTQPVCGAHERTVGLALEETPTGPAVYLAIEEAGPVSLSELTRGRVVALNGSGSATASSRLCGVPTQLALGPRSDGLERLLYVVETRSGQNMEPPLPYDGRLLRLSPHTLQPEAEATLDVMPTRLTVGPRDAVYLLAGDVLTSMEPANGRVNWSLRLPARGIALAVAAETVYVASAYEGRLWRVDGRTGRHLDTAVVNARPSALLH